MPDKLRTTKLSGRQQIYVCTLLAGGYNAERVCEDLKEKYDIDMSLQNIYQSYIHSKKWKKVIARISDQITKRLAKHPLADKTKRLDILNKAINEAMTWRLDKIHYNTWGLELSRVMKRNLGPIPSLIREARVEIEGDKALIDNSTHYHLTTEKKDKYRNSLKRLLGVKQGA